jgi:hypothetical protein
VVAEYLRVVELCVQAWFCEGAVELFLGLVLVAAGP